MADERTGLERIQHLTAGGVLAPKPFPKMPDALKKFGSKEFQDAMRAWDKEIQEWHKTPVVGVTT